MIGESCGLTFGEDAGPGNGRARDVSDCVNVGERRGEVSRIYGDPALVCQARSLDY